MANDPGTPNGAKLLDETRNGLKRLYIREGEAVGGDKWREDFVKLRKEIIPEYRNDQ